MVDLPSPPPSSKAQPHSAQVSTFQSLASLIRLPNQVGTLLLLLPSLWSLVLATHGLPPLTLFFVFLFGAFLMRSVGVVINDWADRSFDVHVERTKQRPLASGVLKPHHAIFFGCVLLVLASSLLMFLNPFTISLAPIALLLAMIYPFTKRFFSVPQFFLGLAFGWGAIMAWSAIRKQLDPQAWLLFGATILWAIAYDTIYATQDQEDDRKIGIQSSAIFFGNRVWLGVGSSLIGMLILLGMAGYRENLNFLFYGILVGVAGFFIRQVVLLRKGHDPARAFVMFREHVYAGLAILTGIWLGTW